MEDIAQRIQDRSVVRLLDPSVSVRDISQVSCLGTTQVHFAQAKWQEFKFFLHLPGQLLLAKVVAKLILDRV